MWCIGFEYENDALPENDENERAWIWEYWVWVDAVTGETLKVREPYTVESYSWKNRCPKDKRSAWVAVGIPVEYWFASETCAYAKCILRQIKEGIRKRTRRYGEDDWRRAGAKVTSRCAGCGANQYNKVRSEKCNILKKFVLKNVDMH